MSGRAYGVELAARAPAVAPFPFFRFGAGTVSLALVGGGLILDSGEAENTFLYRCQDRYLAYTALLGLRSILLVSGEAHARRYDMLIRQMHEKLSLVAEHCGGFMWPTPQPPFYVQCDLTTLRVADGFARFERQAAQLRADGSAVCFVLNQVSPSTYLILAQLERALRERGVATAFDARSCETVANLALAVHNKERYVRLLRGGRARGLPPHVPTAVISGAAFLAIASWPELVAAYRCGCADRSEVAALFVKSAQDSSGNVSARLTRDNFSEKIAAFKSEVRRRLLSQDIDYAELVAELRAEIDAAPSLRHYPFSERALHDFRRRQSERRQDIGLLVQAAICPPPDRGDRCCAVGVSVMIDAAGAVRPIAVAAQLYKDDERRQFLGSYLSQTLARDVLSAARLEKLRALCALFAAEGYCGPINFDACLDERADYTFVYDCNPRLTAIGPPLAVAAALAQHGLRADSVQSLGYRGEFVIQDLAACLDAWRRAGLLCTPQYPRGAIVLPNLSRQDGYDVTIVNHSIAEAAGLLARMRESAGDGVSSSLAGIFH